MSLAKLKRAALVLAAFMSLALGIGLVLAQAAAQEDSTPPAQDEKKPAPDAKTESSPAQPAAKVELPPAEPPGYEIVAASFLGGAGDADAVVGAAIQADGTIVLAANLAPDVGQGLDAAARPGQAEKRGAAARVSKDGARLLTLHRIADELKDLALDGEDAICVAAGPAGAVKLTPQADRVLWKAELGGSCDRLDAGGDGVVAALVDGAKIVLLDAAGKQTGVLAGAHAHNDVCVDGASRTVIALGFRNARAFEGNRVEPVQISYLKAFGYDGKEKWSAYDWSTDQKSDRFINKPTNNMADSRGYRCAIGRDGKLYTGFEAAGGNHIFRYSPTDIMKPQPTAGGDQYHQFYGGGGAAHRTIFMRFEPATGALLAEQQWTPRSASGRCGNMRQKSGGLAADEDGRPFLTGWSDPSIPLGPDPCAAEEPKGGPYLLGMTPDFKFRLVVTRVQAKGWGHAVAVRRIGDKVVAVYAGSGAEAGMFVKNPLQKEPQGKDGFFVILQGDPQAEPLNKPKPKPPPAAPPPAKPDDAGKAGGAPGPD